MSRIRALDGWRGIAILMVLADHIYAALWHNYRLPLSETGCRGVNIFFVLSGFLITSKLLESSDLKKFYVRRFFRLMPVAWGYLLVLGLFRGTSIKEIVTCVFFVRNFAGNIGYASHYWSLSIEEQFYLTWPSVLLGLGRRKAAWFAGVSAIICGSLHFALWKHDALIYPVKPTWSFADGLFVGCFFALLISEESIRDRLKPLLKRLIIPAAAIYFACVLTSPQRHFSFIEDICVGVWITATTVYQESLMSRTLSFAPLVWIGMISYSIYVWQELFMAMGKGVLMWTAMPIVCVLSYYGLEQPLNRLGHRITNRGAFE
jgi:peptidoglycan/LPS O-acetylase OafA/YrhL